VYYVNPEIDFFFRCHGSQGPLLEVSRESVTGEYKITISYYPVIVLGECEGEEVVLLPLALIGHALRLKVQKGKNKLSLA
jgi:hypothetical protein